MATNEVTRKIKKHSKALMAAVLPRIEPLISGLLKRYPYWQLAFYEAIGLYGYYMALKQEEVNEYIEFIKSHPKEFRKEIVESKEFRDGFVLAFQDYLKLRIKEKKIVAKNILLGFTESDSKEKFEIERLDDVLTKISPFALSTLIFLKKKILPLKEKIIKEDLKKRDIKTSGKSKKWWFDQDWRREHLSRFIQQWIYDNYNPNSPKVKNLYGIKNKWKKDQIDKVFEKERKKRIEIYEAIDELVNLGVLKLQVSSGGGISMAGGSAYDFSKLGYEFINYIEDL